MPNTSATGGALLPSTTPAPLEGAALQNFLHDWFVALSGLDNTMVRPRWQAEPVNIPQATDSWLAFGITRYESDTFASEQHFASGSGYNEIRRHEVLNILLSFYGPSADSYAAILRDGMQVAQNREVLTLNAMGLVESGEVVAVPELVKDKWYYRADLTVRIRRQIVRQYAVQNLLTGHVGLDNEHYVTPINV